MSSTIREENLSYFLAEAQDLLQTIEQGLFTLREQRTTAKVHELMRAAHTLKGAAASMDLATVKSVAHVMEDIFRGFYNPDAVLDSEVESLLFNGYECLRLSLATANHNSQVDEADLLNRTANIIAQIQTKMGDSFSQETSIPTSAELGFDIVQSMFEVGVMQRLKELQHALKVGDPAVILKEFRAKGEIFQGLAESLGLPGLGAIAETMLAALELHPDRATTIAKVALRDFHAGQKAVLAGDRTQGGQPSPELVGFVGLPSGLSASLPNSTQPSSFLEADMEITLDDLSLDSLVGHMEQPQPSAMAGSTSLDPNTAANAYDLDALMSELENIDPEFPDEALVEATIADNSFTPPTTIQTSQKPLQRPLPQATRLEQPVAPKKSSPPPIPESPPTVHSILENPTLINTALATPSNSNPTHSSSTNPAISPDVLPTNPQSANIRVDVTQIERLDHLTGELLINQNQQTNQNEHLRRHLRRLLEQLQQHRRTIYELRDWSDRTLTGQRPSLQAKTSLFKDGQPLTTPSDRTNRPINVTPQFDAIEMDRYSQLNILVQNALNETVELEETTEDLEQKTRQSSQTLEGQHRLLANMRDDLTHARMQPLGVLLNRFPRVLKQLVDAYQKRVELTLEGTEVLIDKAVIDKLYDPLLHLIRNAFDHGIEPLEVRRAHGKPDIGRIKLQAYQRGNYTYINVTDDGQGIDLNKLAERAVTLSFYNRQQIAAIADSQLMELLFQPGFSTLAKVSELSGRGIGLDVVRTQIQTIKGNVSIHSTLGQGTTFSLKIPLSLTINRLLVCEANGFTYALPSDLIERIIIPNPDQIRSLSHDRQAILLNQQGEERLIALYSLADLVPYAATQDQFRTISQQLTTTAISHTTPTDSAQLQTSKSTPVLLVRLAEGLVGWRISQVMGEQELVIRPLGNAIAPPPYLYGSSILSNSRLALVLDPIALMQYHQATQQSLSPTADRASPRTTIASRQEKLALSPTMLGHSPTQASRGQHHAPVAKPSPRSSRKVLLVIDDSLTLRRALTQTLQQAGYEVFQAKDGMDALQQLQDLQTPALIASVICDVEMPRMNGFEFLSQFRKQPTTSQIPVIMLTSRTHEKYRRIAEGLGANAYITKPYNDAELLSILANVQKNPLVPARL